MEEYCNPFSNCEKVRTLGKQYGTKESEGPLGTPLGNIIGSMWEHNFKKIKIQ
jgi:hypothetical protein